MATFYAILPISTTHLQHFSRPIIYYHTLTGALDVVFYNIFESQDRDKNQIEQAFKDVKSFIRIQPFNVWTPKHVRAHYTICVLSYLLDITIANRLKEVDIGVRSPQKVYEVLKDGVIGKITIKSTGDEFLKLISLQSQQKAILELFQSENVVNIVIKRIKKRARRDLNPWPMD